MLANYGDSPFHLSLMLKGFFPGRIGNKSVMMFHVGIGPVYGWVVDVRLYNP